MRTRRYLNWSLTAIIAVLGIYSIFKYYEVRNLENIVENNYNRAFHELVNYVDDIDVLLEKSMLVSSPAKVSSLSSEIFRQATAAKACLGQLPLSEANIENTEKFLSQIGDYTYVLSQNVIKDGVISNYEYETLQELCSYAQALNDNLLAMQRDIYDGTISFGSINKKGNEYIGKTASAKSNDIISNFETVEKEFQEYPSLIYDGPFSEHIENIKPVLLENEKVITYEQGLSIAKNFLGEKGQNLAYTGESVNTPIESYSYSTNYNDSQICINISKKGGKVVYFIDSRNCANEQLGFKDAISKATDFLRSNGYTNLKESYYDKSNGVATINFATTQGDVVCYPDLIKVRVGLDNGEILGIETNGYIMNHKQRQIPQNIISADEAYNKINKNLKVTATAKTIIPTESKREVLCYEFKGRHNDKNFLIYINAMTGAEEEILMLLESENGILTM